MKLRAVTVSRFLGRFRKAEPALREAVLDAAAEALLHELQYAGALETEISKHGSKRFVGSGNAADAEREFGTLEQNSSPWLAPVLPWRSSRCGRQQRALPPALFLRPATEGSDPCPLRPLPCAQPFMAH